MLAWLMENMATIIISAVLVLVVATVIVGMIRGKKKGKSSCGCGCAGCAMNGACHPTKPETSHAPKRTEYIFSWRHSFPE